MTSPALSLLSDPRHLANGQANQGACPQRRSAWSAETLRRLLLWTVLYVIPGVIALQPVIDWDIWWHLRTGQWIVEHGTVPTTDPFSLEGQGKPWIAYSWLFEVLVYDLHQGLGLRGILLYRVLLTLAIAVMLHRLVARREPRFVLATGLVGLALLALAPMFQERSWLFSILFYILTLGVVLDLRAGINKKSMWFLPLAYAAWANIHIQFVNGLFLLGLACAAPLGDWLIGRGQPGDSAATAGSRGWWRLVALAGVCFLATFLNPYTWRLYVAVLELPTQTAVFNMVSELHALPFRNGWEWIVLGLTILAAFRLGRWPQVGCFEIALLASSAYFSFRAQRDLWLVVLAACAVLVTGRRSSQTPAPWAVTRPRVLLVTTAVVLALLITVEKRNLTEPQLEEKVAERYPAAAAAFVEQHGYAGPLYNHYNWGGYLIWRLPQLPVAMDGRTIVHGEERMQRSFDTWEGQPEWSSDPELAAAHLIIAQVRTPLAGLLRHDSRFELVYADPIALVFVARENSAARSGG